MTRRTSPALRQSFELELGFVIGPVEGDGLDHEDYELGWRYHGARILGEYVGPFATRPWGWWEFEAGEPMPDGREAEAVRLAELGELSDDELAALRERANEDTDRDRPRACLGRCVGAQSAGLLRRCSCGGVARARRGEAAATPVTGAILKPWTTTPSGLRSGSLER